MKKKYLLLLILLSPFWGKAQLLTEDFNAGVPANGWTIDAHTTNWHQSNSNQAGGTAPEAVMSWDPQFNGTTRLISPNIDLTGIHDVLLTFKQKINDYNGNYTLGVATRTSGGPWHTVWSTNGTNVVEEKSILINNADTNNADFQFCLYFSGDSFNINYWHIDDILLAQAHQTDLAVRSVNVNDFLVQGNNTIACTVKNLGINTITSFDITYSIDGGNAVTENVNGIMISSTNTYDYTFNQAWHATGSGNHEVTVTISNVNGAGNDDDANNNILTKNVNIATQTVTNFPLFEEFTSSTCNPCASFNSSAMGPFMTNHPDDIAVVKYQMNWPGNGDPYYTPEGGVRRSYYSVSGVPSLRVGGKEYPASTSGLNAGLSTENAKSGYFTIDAEYSISGNTIFVNENIMPYVTGNFVVHTVVIEKTTTQNASSNGETEFKHVMMKMLPDAHGTSHNFTANQAFTQSFSYDMSQTHVEEMNDLAVVIFIQYNDNKQVMQAKYLSTQSPQSIDNTIFEHVSIYPNPNKGILKINTRQNIKVSVTDMLGNLVIPEKEFNQNGQLDLSHLTNALYLIKINDGKRFGIKKIILNK